MSASRQTTPAKLKKLDATVAECKTLLIVVQDYPDPDAIASAAALREWAFRRHAIACTIGFGGVVGRMENRALLNYLDLPIRHLHQLDPQQFDAIALVDTQPGTGNNALPPTVTPRIVIDHHPCRRATRQSAFTDIRRRYGATSTILYEYLQASQLELSAPLATALLYGIRSDTQNLGRESGRADLEASLALYRLANIRMVRLIEQANVPTSYFRLLSRALLDARQCGSAFVSFPGVIETPDQIGEVAELLLRHEACDWALCVGEFERRWLLSLRTSVTGADAGTVMHRLVAGRGTGGGHRTMAGGQIPLPPESTPNQRADMEKHLMKRLARLTRQTGSAPYRALLDKESLTV